MTFHTTFWKSETKNVSGIIVPEDVVVALGGGKRPAVRVTLQGYTYRSTIAKMGEHYLISFSSEHRTNSGLKGDETLDVTLELDTAPRRVEPPEDLKVSLEAAGLLAAFMALAPSHQKEYVRNIEEAKTPETRERRISKAVEKLSLGH